MKYLSVLFIHLFACAIISGPLYGQGLSDTLAIEEIIIASSRVQVNDPISIQTIQLESIESIYAGQDPAVLLEQLSPSIISYSDAGTDIGNYAQFRMRGISQDRINVSLNGVPLNDMADQGTFFSNFSDFANSAESIQIQRGVGASRAGVASYGGAVNFESINPFKDDSHSGLQLTTGSFGTLRASAEVGTGLVNNKSGMYGRFTRTLTDGYKNHSGSDSYSLFLSGGILGDKEVFKVTALSGKTENDQSYLSVLLSDIEDDPKTNYNHPNDTDNFEQEMVQVQYGRQHTDKVSSNYTLYYGGARGVFPFGLDNTTQLMFGIYNKRFGAMANVNYKNESIDITGGLHGFTFNRENEDYTAPNIQEPFYRDQTDKKAISAFSKIRYTKEQLSIYGDLQIRNVNMSFHQDIGGIDHDRSWTFLNWLGGINYELSDQSALYGSIGRTSREPTRSNIFQGSESEIRSDILDAESVVDVELGWRLTSSKLQIAANFFLMNFNNEIVRTGALQENSYMDLTQNVSNSRRYGLEVQSNYQLSPTTSLSLNLAQLNSKIDQFDSGVEVFNDVKHIFMPSWNINTSLTHKFSDKFSAILSGRYVSESFIELSNDDSFTLPSYLVLNTQFNYQINKQLTCSLFLNNLTDKLYFTDGSVVDIDFDGIVDGPGYRVQPPRAFYLMIGWKF